MKTAPHWLLWTLTIALLAIGSMSILSGRFGGRRGVGMVTGSTAVTFGTITLVLGLYFCYLLLSQKKE